MYDILKHTHSGLRWVALLLMLTVIVTAWQTWKSNAPYKQRLTLFTLIVSHLQLLLGLIMYFMSPHVQFGEGFMKDSVLRFYGVEHITIMVLAITLITMGYSKAKRQADDRLRGQVVVRLFGIALVLILLGIPWPFRIPVAGWF
ncbi:MAG: cytochrome B [Saprospiraceae bacterium]|nr:cytochrome B [Saprospiraceae bacterium]